MFIKKNIDDQGKDYYMVYAKDDDDLVKNIDDWCFENFGKAGPETWQPYGSRSFAFTNKELLTFFVLRWS